MAATRWEPSSVKAQLRLTSLRLGQLQEKLDSQGTTARKDIATFLQNRNSGLARARVQKLLKNDATGDLLEVLGMHVGQLLEHFHELEHSIPLTPSVAEAVSTIIYAAPHIESQDLKDVGHLLAEHLGAEFAYSTIKSQDERVAPNALQILTSPPPSAEVLDIALEKIAQENGVEWLPELSRQETLVVLSEILDPRSGPIVDIAKLRSVCCRGIPDDPSWLRPRIWKLFLGILPVLKSSWSRELQKQRGAYYDMVRRLLNPFSTSSPTSLPLASLDAILLRAHNQLSNVPHKLFRGLDKAPESHPSCPLENDAEDVIKIVSARNLDIRLDSILSKSKEGSTQSPMFDLRPGSEAKGLPSISLVDTEKSSDTRLNGSITHLSEGYHFAGNAHPKHISALLRLLYLHASINPGNTSPHVPSLLVPLYAVLNQEVDPEHLAHAEADTFWLFEAIVGEFSELEDEEGGRVWMRKFSEHLEWADPDLSSDLKIKGLDPALPHYSYQWLASLLAYTLPLSSVLPIWDALFSCPVRTRDSNPKVDKLVSICTAMLIRARAALFRSGKSGRKSPSIWAEGNDHLPPPSPLRTWELGDAFTEGMSLLQLYPVEAAGGIDRILQTDTDLSYRREEEVKASQKDKLSLGARIRDTMWRGFTNQVSSAETSPEESDDEDLSETLHEEDGNDTETPGKGEPGLTSRLATTVWKGITNQTSMEPPVTPLTPAYPPTSLSPSLSSPTHASVQNSSDDNSKKSSLWAYAGKLKDSDALATFSKVSSNWRAKAMLGSWVRPGPLSPPAKDLSTPARAISRSESVSEGHKPRSDGNRRGSLPSADRSNVYSPPPRPPYFRPPRDSFAFPENITTPGQSPQADDDNSSGFVEKAQNLQSSLMALTRTSPSQPAPKSAPRPLLLGSTPVTSPPIRPIVSRSAGSTPAPDRGEWADVMRLKGHSLHRNSQSSISSLSPSDALRSAGSSRSDWDSDIGVPSRRVPLNRKSVSPLAPGFRTHRGRMISRSSSATSSDHGLLSPPLSSHSDLQGWSRADAPESPPSMSPATSKVHAASQLHTGATVPPIDNMLASDDTDDALREQKPDRKKLPLLSPVLVETSDSSETQIPPRSPRSRSKRHIPRPPNLNIQEDSPYRKSSVERKLSNSNSLTVELLADEQEVARTPRASNFNVENDGAVAQNNTRSLRRSRKVSAETQERYRKTSGDDPEVRTRKNSGQRAKALNERKEVGRKTRESSADEGDDEGYDDLLSAYESESSQTAPLR